MKIAFLTETQFHGKWANTMTNARTEIAWQIALDADHYWVGNFAKVAGYDLVIVIFPKGGVSLNSEGIQLNNTPNRFDALYSASPIETLKKNNKKVAHMQEGPTWYVNDFSINDQFNFYNQLSECDILFAHNNYDCKWYRGCFPGKKVYWMPSLMLENLVCTITPNPQNKTIIGGGCCRWYGGFQSYLVSDEFKNPIFVPSMHNARPLEDTIPNLTRLPYLQWFDWMKQLSSFKYAVHMMPTIAAGTFSLNCAYFGIPCIGNINVDTQLICHPYLSFEAEDVEGARYAAKKLKEDDDFYKKCSESSKIFYKKHFNIDVYKQYMNNILSQ
jgi:hypothetical protein